MVIFLLGFPTVLRVMSIEMDLAERGFISKVFIKGRGAEIFSNLRPSPFL
jgi:hypothetical protein